MHILSSIPKLYSIARVNMIVSGCSPYYRTYVGRTTMKVPISLPAPCLNSKAYTVDVVELICMPLPSVSLHSLLHTPNNLLCASRYRRHNNRCLLNQYPSPIHQLHPGHLFHLGIAMSQLHARHPYCSALRTGPPMDSALLAYPRHQTHAQHPCLVATELSTCLCILQQNKFKWRKSIHRTSFAWLCHALTYVLPW